MINKKQLCLLSLISRFAITVRRSSRQLVIVFLILTTVFTVELNLSQSLSKSIVSSGTRSNRSSTRRFKMYWGSVDKFKITMKLHLKDGEIKGYYFYDKVKTPLKLKGKFDPRSIYQRMGDNAAINEFDDQGKKTGEFKGVLTDYEFFGVWTGKKRNYKFQLTAVDSMGKGSVKIQRKQDARYKTDSRDGIVISPEVSGIEPEVLKKIARNLEFGEVFDPDVQGWLNESTYYVTYNKNDILSMIFWQEGIGAYPDSSLAVVSFDLKTGEFLKTENVFKKDALDKLVGLLNTSLEGQIKLKEKEIGEGEKEAVSALKSQTEGAGFDPGKLDVFLVNDEGITFLYLFGFPHVSKALEPNGDIFIPYQKLRNFVKIEGPLGRILTK